jgi:hypothetical protein
MKVGAGGKNNNEQVVDGQDSYVKIILEDNENYEQLKQSALLLSAYYNNVKNNELLIPNNGLVDLSNLINYDYSTKHTEMSKFLLSMKLKIAILSFITQIAVLPRCSTYVKANAKAIIWFLVPFLCTFQGKDIIELAIVGIKAVYHLEPIFGFLLIRSITENQLTSWEGITADPCINDILDKRICPVEVILRFYRKDLGLLERLKEIEESDELMKIATADRKWNQNYLKNWATI